MTVGQPMPFFWQGGKYVKQKSLCIMLGVCLFLSMAANVFLGIRRNTADAMQEAFQLNLTAQSSAVNRIVARLEEIKNTDTAETEPVESLIRETFYALTDYTSAIGQETGWLSGLKHRSLSDPAIDRAALVHVTENVLFGYFSGDASFEKDVEVLHRMWSELHKRYESSSGNAPDIDAFYGELRKDEGTILNLYSELGK